MSLEIGLVYDLRKEYLASGFSPEATAEFDSEETVNALRTTIISLGHHARPIGSAKALAQRLVDGDRWDLVFNIAEGVSGRSREAQVPCLLELYGVPYTFSDPLVLAATLDKAVTKRLVRSFGLPTPDFVVVENAAGAEQVNLRYPVFAKPVAEGSGKGVSPRSVAHNAGELKGLSAELIARFREPVLVEEFLPGREFTVGVLGTGAGAAVLGAMEVKIRAAAGPGVYSYQNKEECETKVRYSPLEEKELYGEVAALALDAYRALECRDAGRVDLRCDGEGRPNFVEINPLPGLHPTHSDLPMIAAQEGLSYGDLLDRIMRSACERQGIRP